MNYTILKGNIVSSTALNQLEITENGYLVAADGIIQGVFATLPEAYEGHVVQDYRQKLIVQSFSDLHLHAPQYPMIGLGMDLPLLDWLNTYTFPLEARFADNDYARKIYRQLAQELIANGTTRVCMFSSLHREATLILMEELENAGVTGYVGKVNMDRNSGDVLQETTEQSMAETALWLEQCEKFEHIHPMITPRFTPSCSDELMAYLGKLAQEKNLPIQSHLSENDKEIAWVQELHPDCEQYWQSYAKYGLWNDKTVMAHCVWSDERERKAMKDAGVTVAFCANSNTNICSGVTPVRAMLNEGLQVGLGSDIAGGHQIEMHQVIASTIATSKHTTMTNGAPCLTVAEGWYLGTSGGSEFFGEQAGFAKGNPLHALVIDDSHLPQVDSVEARFERSIYRRQTGAITAVWSAGRKVLG
ncbi:amidohydrolase family protein [Bengtsoniella intestinalis]|uniref:amidohydrolase family protein n=1 Tax=Bengtsoniella intestinalis TaxID=3073143 RepID=UPI00391F6CC4